METSSRSGYNMRVCVLLLYITIAAIFFTHCDARRSVQLSKRPRHLRSLVIKTTKKLKVRKNLGIETYSTPSSPFSLPPFESLGPMPMPDNAPPYCLYPPTTTTTPLPPSTAIPPPLGYTPSSPFYLPPALPIQSPPPSPTIIIPGPPTILPGPPEAEPSPFIYIPSPPGSTLSPPYYEPSPPSYIPPSPPLYVPSPTGFVPSPPSYVPSPPSYVPSPTGFVPSPPVFEPPVVFPPPTVPPPPNKAPNTALWCVAKPSVPDPIIQEAMDYACWSGADCSSILPTGSCFQPNTLFAHASFAFNSYWQRTRVAGGTCEFGGTAILVTVDPSYDGCHFDYY